MSLILAALSPDPSQNLNYENQQDLHYQGLRTRAKDEGSKMAQCYEESHTAYASGDRARAKELSNEGKAHKAEMERLNAQASEWIFASMSSSSSFAPTLSPAHDRFIPCGKRTTRWVYAAV